MRSSLVGLNGHACPLAALVLSALLAWTASVRAAGTEDATRAAARQLAAEGRELFEGQDFEQARERFSRAYQLVPTPTLGLWEARSLLRLGRWVEASERFLDVQRQPLPEGAPPEHQQARADATAERHALLPRIPALRVTIDGALPSEVSVTLNGELLPAPLVGVKRPVNPGKLAVRAARGDEVVVVNVELAEGEQRDVTLAFAPDAPPPAVAAPPPAAAASVNATGRSDAGASQRTVAYVALGAGSAGILVGSVFGIAALTKKADLEAACPDRRCPPSQFDTLGSYETQRALSIVGFSVGAVLAAGGVALLLSAPEPQRKRTQSGQRRVGVRLGFGQAHVFGELP